MDGVHGGGPWTRGPCFVLSLHKLPLVRIAESFEVCNYLSIKFAVLLRQRNPAKPYRGLPQASHGINTFEALLFSKKLH